MTVDEFIGALKIQTSDGAVTGTVKNLERVPGRKPREKDLIASAWYGSLPDADREMVKSAMRKAAQLAVFSFLCVVDGVSVIDDGPQHGSLKLLYTRNGDELLLNDPRGEYLHDVYNALCQQED